MNWINGGSQILYIWVIINNVITTTGKYKSHRQSPCSLYCKSAANGTSVFGIWYYI